MTFIANNLVITGNNAGNLHITNGGIVELPHKTEEVPSANNYEVTIETVNNATIRIVDTHVANTLSYNRDHHVLIVNGKEKKVSKHSAYLLDMLTTDE